MEHRRVKGCVCMMQPKRGRRRLVMFCLVLGMLSGMLAGCSSDGITDETLNAVREKKSQVLTLYSDVEKLVQDNSIAVDESFTNMKQQLIDMSDKVEKEIANTTETDGQNALKELERLEGNLQEAKKSVEEQIAQ